MRRQCRERIGAQRLGEGFAELGAGIDPVSQLLPWLARQA